MYHFIGRLAFAASEVFACDVQSLQNVFFEEGNSHLLDRLFSFLARPAPLPATTAGYFRKVVGVLCSRKYDEVCACKTQVVGCSLLSRGRSLSWFELYGMLVFHFFAAHAPLHHSQGHFVVAAGTPRFVFDLRTCHHVPVGHWRRQLQ